MLGVALPLLSPSAPFTINSPLSTRACVAMVGYPAYDLGPLLYHRAEWGGGNIREPDNMCRGGLEG